MHRAPIRVVQHAGHQRALSLSQTIQQRIELRLLRPVSSHDPRGKNGALATEAFVDEVVDDRSVLSSRVRACHRPTVSSRVPPVVCGGRKFAVRAAADEHAQSLRSRAQRLSLRHVPDRNGFVRSCLRGQAGVTLVVTRRQVLRALAGSETHERPGRALACRAGASPQVTPRQRLDDQRLPRTTDGVGQVEFRPDVDEQRTVDVVEQVGGTTLAEEHLVSPRPASAVVEVVQPPRLLPVVVWAWEENPAEGAFRVQPPQPSTMPAGPSSHGATSLIMPPV